MIAISDRKYNTNCNKDNKMKDYSLTRKAVLKARRWKNLKKRTSILLGLLSILLMAGAPIQVSVEISSYPMFTFQIALAFVFLIVAFWIWGD